MGTATRHAEQLNGHLDIAGDEGFDGHGDALVNHDANLVLGIAGDEGFDGHGDLWRNSTVKPIRQIAGDEGFDGQRDGVEPLGQIFPKGYCRG